MSIGWSVLFADLNHRDVWLNRNMTLNEYREKTYGSKYCVGFGEKLFSPINDLGGKGHDKPTSITHNLINLQFAPLFLFGMRSK
jgi:hypothetical protein